MYIPGIVPTTVIIMAAITTVFADTCSENVNTDLGCSGSSVDTWACSKWDSGSIYACQGSMEVWRTEGTCISGTACQCQNNKAVCV